MSSIRVLILGVLKQRDTIHGYELRRELETWNAEQWANIAYGSIYFSLNKMTQEGLVEVVAIDQINNRPARTVYRITEKGIEEFYRLLREYWKDVKPVIDPFQVALTFINALPKDEILGYFKHRINALNGIVELLCDENSNKLLDPGTPRHILENLRLAADHMETEIRWIERAIGKVERDELP
ncbi:MAG: PadR family transcriptional regulator [Chloroflexi bacterium]|uniref:PadR family transcriptional regulator n=1 Tax=Candidatus Chlorohelix allophototropha TaxID=3003348 RepID=A0A8T7LQK3_9CHLR|nr:PadR family transcriptional regulator [Chloroflexota bacterium]WJW66188.1 PadR family transcriptional regulator [Chloroflexota bacterium L227-S17]